MSTKAVVLVGTFTGFMTVDDAVYPSHPISLPGDPGYGQIPGFGGPGGGRPIYPGEPGYPVRPSPAPQPPYPSQGPGFPTNPIAGFDPIHGTWPKPPYPSQGPGFPTHPIAGFDPIHGTWPNPPVPPVFENPPDFQPIAGGRPGPVEGYTWYYSPTYGWVLGVPPSATTKPSPPKEEIPVQPGE